MTRLIDNWQLHETNAARQRRDGVVRPFVDSGQGAPRAFSPMEIGKQ